MREIQAEKVTETISRLLQEAAITFRMSDRPLKRPANEAVTAFKTGRTSSAPRRESIPSTSTRSRASSRSSRRPTTSHKVGQRGGRGDKPPGGGDGAAQVQRPLGYWKGRPSRHSGRFGQCLHQCPEPPDAVDPGCEEGCINGEFPVRIVSRSERQRFEK